MNFDDAIKLIQDGKFNHLKIVDTDGKKLMDLNAETADSLISQLEGYKPILSSHGRLKFLAANESIFKQNWRDAFTWNIVFTTTSPANSNLPAALGHVPSGFVSANEASLMAQLQTLQMQREFDNKLTELNRKLDEKDSGSMEKYLPMLGLLVDIDPKKLETMVALSGMQAAMNGKAPAGLAGLQEKGALVQTTVEEKALISEINNELEKLSEKVEISKIAMFIKTLNEKPQFLDTLIAMAATHK